jgi:hypothetical protein
VTFSRVYKTQAAMKLHRVTWWAIAAVAVLFALLNLHSWQPGIGGHTDRVKGVPAGSEIEHYYGWPACYRAELLRSDDPGMRARVLKTAPLYVLRHTGYGRARDQMT